MEYTGEKKGSDRLMLAAIQLNSVVARIIAKSMENGAGIRRAHQNAMQWLRRRIEAGEQNVEH
jgi:ribosomal protein S3